MLSWWITKTKIEEGKVIEGKINKITEKFVFLFIEGLKSEPVLDINELKSNKLLCAQNSGIIDFTIHNFLH